MRKWLASIIATGVLCSFLVLNMNYFEIGGQPVYLKDRLMSTTSNGEGS